MSKVELESSPTGVTRNSRTTVGGESNWLEVFVDRSPVRAFVLLSILYVIVVLSLSRLKLLWLDELITLHIARLPSVDAIWNALAQGADPNPPITHVLVHGARIVFGDRELAYRLPAFAGYWIGLLSLFLYLGRRVPATWALAGTIMSMAMAAFDYSYESRSYAIFYGLAMLAMFCWSVAVDSAGTRFARYLALAGMLLALAAGISTNYFAVLAFVPIAAGELTRTISKLSLSRSAIGSRGRTRTTILQTIDFPIWISLAAAGSTLLAYRSLIAHAIAQFSPYAWNKVSIDQVFDSYTEMVEVILFPILGLFVLLVFILFLRRQLAPYMQGSRASLSQSWIGSVLFPDSSRLRIPLHELAAVFAFMAYPILGYILASIRGGMLSPRFVIPVCFGFAIAATFVAFYLFSNLRHAGAALLCFCAAWFIARESVVAFWYAEQKVAFHRIVDRLAEAEVAVPANAPIVIPDPLLALTFRHYAPASLAARVVFPVDFPAIRAYRHDDSPEENLWAGRNLIYDMPILPMATFQHSAGNYLIIAADENWMIRDLRIHQYVVRRLPVDTGAKAIGGFTPLAHGTPFFYTAAGDAAPVAPSLPQPFHAADNLPDSKAVCRREPRRNDGHV